MSQGSHHWRVQRLTALALIPLTIWFVLALVSLPDYSFGTMHDWAATPWRAALIGVLVSCVAWHSQLGVQVVIEDYVHGGTKSLALVLSTLVHVLLGAAGVLAALAVAVGD